MKLSKSFMGAVTGTFLGVAIGAGVAAVPAIGKLDDCAWNSVIARDVGTWAGNGPAAQRAAMEYYVRCRETAFNQAATRFLATVPALPLALGTLGMVVAARRRDDPAPG